MFTSIAFSLYFAFLVGAAMGLAKLPDLTAKIMPRKVSQYEKNC